MGHSNKQGMKRKPVVRVSCYDRIPREEISLGHFIEKAACFRTMVVLGESRDHGVEGDDVALGHGGEDGEGLIDFAAFSELSGLLVGEEDSVHGCRHDLFWWPLPPMQRSHVYSYDN